MTKPPRTRDGKAFPGGRALRRNLARLARRRRGYNESVERDAKNQLAMTMPGSMK